MLLTSIRVKVETPYHDNDLIMTPIISPQSGLTTNVKLPGTSHGGFRDGGWRC
jgi:hypothetical protein